MEFYRAKNPISHKTSSQVGVLVIHGASSTPGSMAYVCDQFIRQGFNVECPLLPGHGTAWEDLEKYYWWDWVFAMEQALDELSRRCAHVFVSGLSLGGGIAIYLAAHHPELKGMILFNHLCKMNMNLIARWSHIVRLIVRSIPAIGGDIKDASAKEPVYDRFPTHMGWQVVTFSKEVQKKLSKVVLPTLIFKSREDHVLPVESATFTYENIASTNKELVWLENSYHVVTMDFDKGHMMDKSIDFINKLAK